MRGHGYKKCSREKQKLTQEEYINKCKIVWNDKYILDKIKYVDMKTKILVTCKIHGDFYTNPIHFIRGHGCKNCVKNISKNEKEIFDFIKKFDFKISATNRYLLNDGYEIDLYLPEKQIGFEYNGLYWHDENHRKDDYHFSS